ncbi:Prophage PssSM-02 [Pseudomonas chlororaphis]
MSSSERMAPDQIARLTLAITATAEVLGQTITSEAVEMMADDLADYPAEAVAGALKACRRELTGKLTLAAILQRVQAADGRPGKDEAWAIAMTTNDEFETVVLTDEIQLALAAAKPVLDAGDKVGARMAFISAYERFVSQAREDAKPVNWHVSVGFDANRRIQAVTKAVEMQRIPQERGRLYLADLNVTPVTEDGRAVVALLTGEVARPSPKLRAKLEAVRNSMLEMRATSAKRKDEMRIEAANELADRRAMLVQQAQELDAGRAAQ